MNRALWVIQGLLALVFVFSGGIKLFMSAEVLAAATPLPELLYRSIGVAALIPFAVALLSAFVAYRCCQPELHRETARHSSLQIGQRSMVTAPQNHHRGSLIQQ